MALPKENERYTYADYCTWDDSERWELIDGEAYNMSAPGEAHQIALVELLAQLHSFLRGKPCKVFVAPFSVRLNAEGTDDTVVEPDLTVVCDQKKLDGKGVVGAPDFVIEIISPSSVRRDRIVKFNLYRNAGVREYWIVEPETKTVQACTLKDGQYILAAYGDEDTAPVHILPGCEINLNDVFTS
jgi:Uma2 family endonuclease